MANKIIVLGVVLVIAIAAVVAMGGFSKIGGGVSGSTVYDSERARAGDTVKVAYELTVDGELIQENNAYIFTIGAGGILPGFDRAVRGLAVGETKAVTLTGEDAYPLGHFSGLGGKTLNFKITLLDVS